MQRKRTNIHLSNYRSLVIPPSPTLTFHSPPLPSPSLSLPFPLAQARGPVTRAAGTDDRLCPCGRALLPAQPVGARLRAGPPAAQGQPTDAVPPFPDRVRCVVIIHTYINIILYTHCADHEHVLI